MLCNEAGASGVHTSGESGAAAAAPLPVAMVRGKAGEAGMHTSGKSGAAAAAPLPGHAGSIAFTLALPPGVAASSFSVAGVLALVLGVLSLSSELVGADRL